MQEAIPAYGSPSTAIYDQSTELDEDCESTEEYQNYDFSDDSEIGTGSLELIVGPMFCGKTTKAILTITKMADLGYDVLYINHEDDVRETEAQHGNVSTHNSNFKTLSNKINTIKASELRDIDVRDYEYICIDEGQFYPDLYESVITWVTGYGKNVIVASLDGDAYRRKFGQVLDLIPNADKITKLTAYCDLCRENVKRLRVAPFTGRLCDKKGSKVVGGKNIYRAMCRECHDNHLSCIEF